MLNVDSEKKQLDNEVLMRARGGDLAAFESILSFYEKSIFNYSLRITKNEQDAEDITQNTFIKVYNHRHAINPDKNIKTWIFTIATNTAYDFLRSKKRKSEVSFDEETETIASFKSYYNKEGVSVDVEKALSKINPDYKKAILLFYMEGFEYKEIADILAIPINTVKTHISRGKEQLGEFLKDYGKN